MHHPQCVAVAASSGCNCLKFLLFDIFSLPYLLLKAGYFSPSLLSVSVHHGGLFLFRQADTLDCSLSWSCSPRLTGGSHRSYQQWLQAPVVIWAVYYLVDQQAAPFVGDFAVWLLQTQIFWLKVLSKAFTRSPPHQGSFMSFEMMPGIAWACTDCFACQGYCLPAYVEIYWLWMTKVKMNNLFPFSILTLLPTQLLPLLCLRWRLCRQQSKSTNCSLESFGAIFYIGGKTDAHFKYKVLSFSLSLWTLNHNNKP